MIRADITGSNTARYSVARDSNTGALFDVDNTNVDHYVTHRGNSGGRIQPVGQKRPNAFGIELGNVWKISKDLYDSARPHWGRSIRGGSWKFFVGMAESDSRDYMDAGYRYSFVGFSLTRTCK